MIDMSEYKDLFISESREHLQSMNSAILELERTPSDENTLNEILRSAHTLKGMAATMGYNTMAELAHALEDLLDALRRKKIPPGPNLFDLIFGSADALESALDHIREDKPLGEDTAQWIERLRQFLAHPEASPPAEQTWRVHITLDPGSPHLGARAFAILKQMEQWGQVAGSRPHRDALTGADWGNEFVVSLTTPLEPDELRQKVRSAPGVTDVLIEAIAHTEDEERGAKAPEGAAEPAKAPAPPERNASPYVRIQVHHLDRLLNLMGELVISRSRLGRIARNCEDPAILAALNEHAHLLDELQEAVLEARLVPVGQVFDRFPRMVRDLLKEAGKQARFIIEGQELELDRTVVEALAEPLVHLLRNSVDHGLEPPEERVKAGKPAEGLIRLAAFREQDMAVVEVFNDGRHISREEVEKTALSRGLVTSEQLDSMTDEQVLLLICLPDFSSSPGVTRVSGRGVGMYAVKQAVDALRGELEISSSPGEGTTFRLRLPITLSLAEALLVQAGSQQYAIPLSSVNRILDITPASIITLHNRRVLSLDRTIPLFSLREMLGFPPTGEGSPSEGPEAYRHVLLTGRGNNEVALLVDGVIAKEQIVIKPFAGFLSHIPGLAGATILPDGRVVLILDISNLISLWMREGR